MRTGIVLCTAGLMLAGCFAAPVPDSAPVFQEAPLVRAEGEPAPAPADVGAALADVPKASQVDTRPPAKKAGFFSRVFGQDKPAPTPEIELTTETANASGADANRVASLSVGDTDAASTEPTVAAEDGPAIESVAADTPPTAPEDPAAVEAPTAVALVQSEPAPKVNVWSIFKRKEGTDVGKVDADVADTEQEDPTIVVEVETPLDADKVANVIEEPVEAPAELTAPKRGFFAKRTKPKTADGVKESADATVQLAAVAAPKDKATRATRVNKKKSKKASVPLGTRLPFGEVGLQCNAKGAALGRQVDKSQNGSAPFKIYDTQPGSTTPRTFYITGFKDRCARQVTASLILFGDLQLYEVLNFGGGGGSPNSETALAYKQIRSKACASVRKGPCRADGLNKLSKSTAFLTVYPSLGARNHLEVLLSDGQVKAKSLK